ncbi:MAG: hypothetical protein JWR75_2028 [Devosia sp.]|nr:hypothetical protein [Devosia sp.]
MSPTPPIAKQQKHSATHHGITRDDPYHWLRADNWQEVMQVPETLAPNIREYLEAENTYYESAFGKPTEALRETLYREIRGRMKEDETGIPTPDGPFAYNARNETGKQYPILVRTPRAGGSEEILLDCNTEAGDGFFDFGGADHDPSHRWLAWSADRQGSEYYTVHFRDLGTGTDTAEIIAETAGDGEWSADSRHYYYTEYDDNHRPYRVRRHAMGTPQTDDAIIYEESDPGFFVGIGRLLSGAYLVIDSHDHQTSEVRLIDAATGGDPILVAARIAGREYDVDERHGVLYIRTNADDAEDYKIVTAPAATPGAEHWVDLIPHRPGVLVLSADVTATHLLRLERFEGLPRIVIRNLKTNAEETVGFDEEAYSLGMSLGYEFATPTWRLSYSSPTTPSETYDVDFLTGARTLLKRQEVPSGHNPDDYVTRRIFADTGDGERVPVTVLHHRSTPIDGTAPGLIYGYGAYGYSLPAAFSISALSFADRGFIYAVAHVRGGMEKGYGWYRTGRHRDKLNTFNDFIAATEALASQHFVDAKKVVAMGGSAGGLLMGAIANMRPDLYAGIIAQVPFVDVLNTMLDDTLPLTPPEWPEWGNPILSAEDYALIASYAPYEQIAAKAYPPIFVLAGLTDPRVTYWEPAKYVARLRATATGTAPLLLKTNMGAGHQGATGRFEHIKETAQSYAFALWVLGLDKSSP